jgi:energy-dependent translational throttle protein EttA
VAGTEAGAAGTRREIGSAARQKTLQRELEWIRMAPRARQAKSKARIKAYEQMAAEQFEERLDEFEIQIPARQAPGRSGDRGQGTDKGYGDRC